MAVKTKPSKLPTRLVPSDDLVIEADGHEFRVHAGEHVVFRAARQSMDDHLLALRAASLELAVAQSSDDEVDPQALANLEATALQSLERLQRHIVSWDWTDDEGKPYPSPPTIEVLRALDVRELAWLHGQVNPRLDDRQGEADGSSTGS